MLLEGTEGRRGWGVAAGESKQNLCLSGGWVLLICREMGRRRSTHHEGVVPGPPLR